MFYVNHDRFTKLLTLVYVRPLFSRLPLRVTVTPKYTPQLKESVVAVSLSVDQEGTAREYVEEVRGRLCSHWRIPALFGQVQSGHWLFCARHYSC